MAMNSKTDIPKTKERYEALFGSFMDSELMNVNALELTSQELTQMLDRRTKNSGGPSWFERTELFFTRCKLSRIIPQNVGGPSPWTQLLFEPNNLGIVTMSRFTYPNPVIFPRSGWEIDRTRNKANEILGCDENYRTLNYFKNHLGQSYIKCYSFPTHNSFSLGSTYSCIRFALLSYIREALLLTQGYTINFVLNHPTECFPGISMEGSLGLLMDRAKQEELYAPILESRRNELLDIKGRIDQQLSSQDLEPEIS